MTLLVARGGGWWFVRGHLYRLELLEVGVRMLNAGPLVGHEDGAAILRIEGHLSPSVEGVSGTRSGARSDVVQSERESEFWRSQGSMMVPKADGKKKHLPQESQTGGV